MKKIIVMDEPKQKPVCSKCKGEVDWFGYFSVHDLHDTSANGYCKKCGSFETADKAKAYGEVSTITLEDFKKLLGINAKGKNT